MDFWCVIFMLNYTTRTCTIHTYSKSITYVCKKEARYFFIDYRVALYRAYYFVILYMYSYEY